MTVVIYSYLFRIRTNAAVFIMISSVGTGTRYLNQYSEGALTVCQQLSAIARFASVGSNLTEHTDSALFLVVIPIGPYR